MFGGQLYSRVVRRTAHYMDRRPRILIFGRGAQSNAAIVVADGEIVACSLHRYRGRFPAIKRTRSLSIPGSPVEHGSRLDASHPSPGHSPTAHVLHQAISRGAGITKTDNADSYVFPSD